MPWVRLRPSVEAASLPGNAPTDIGCVGLFRDRIFVGRGVLNSGVYVPGGWRPNLLAWSSVGEPEKWPSSNYIVVGESDEPIMALAELGDVLYIFQRTKTWALTGYDEDSFALSLVSNTVGCIHSGSICYHEGRVYWAAESGIYSAAGGGPEPVTHRGAAEGIQSSYIDRAARSDGTRDQLFYRTASMIVVPDYLLTQVRYVDRAYTTEDAYVMNLRTGAWSQFGNDTNADGHYQPAVFAKVGSVYWAFTPWQAVQIDNCYGPESVGDDTELLYDEDYTSAGAQTNSTIDAELQFADLRLAAAETVRVRGVQIEHNCHYYGGSSSPRVAWAATLDYDSEIDTSALTVGDVDARYIGNTGAPAFNKYFTDRFTDDSFPTEGAVFRVKLTKTAQAHSSKVFRVFLVTDGQATFDGRVDNATT